MSGGVVSVWSAAELADAVASGADAAWVIAPGLEPADGALDALRAAVDGGAGLAVGLVVANGTATTAGPAGESGPAAGTAPGGRPVEALLPGAPEGDPERIIALARDHVLPLRWTPLVHALVRRDVVERFGVPDGARFGPLADVVWSARVLREVDGVLVPAARATLTAPLPAARVTPRYAIRAVRAGALTPGEALRRSVASTRSSTAASSNLRA